LTQKQRSSSQTCSSYGGSSSWHSTCSTHSSSQRRIPILSSCHQQQTAPVLPAGQYRMLPLLLLELLPFTALTAK
jgi:hypothetical protein